MQKEAGREGKSNISHATILPKQSFQAHSKKSCKIHNRIILQMGLTICLRIQIQAWLFA